MGLGQVRVASTSEPNAGCAARPTERVRLAAPAGAGASERQRGRGVYSRAARLARHALLAATAQPSRPSSQERTTMWTQHDHGLAFDAGHCRAGAHEAGLLDHYQRRGRREPEMRRMVAGLSVSVDGVAASPAQWHLAYLNDELLREIADRRGGHPAAEAPVLQGVRGLGSGVLVLTNEAADPA